MPLAFAQVDGARKTSSGSTGMVIAVEMMSITLDGRSRAMCILASNEDGITFPNCWVFSFVLLNEIVASNATGKTL
jgi:hypothetical protein